MVKTYPSQENSHFLPFVGASSVAKGSSKPLEFSVQPFPLKKWSTLVHLLRPRHWPLTKTPSSTIFWLRLWLRLTKIENYEILNIQSPHCNNEPLLWNSLSERVSALSWVIYVPFSRRIHASNDFPSATSILGIKNKRFECMIKNI
jgi:hypothetical protein